MHSIAADDSQSKAPDFMQLLSNHFDHVNNSRSLVILLLLVNFNSFVTSQSSNPTVVQKPLSVSPSPSISSTLKPVDEPSLAVSSSPTMSPQSSNPTRTIQPTYPPSTMHPTGTYRPTTSKLPSYSPTVFPTPNPTDPPTDNPTEWPTSSVEPSLSPSLTFLPTTVPTQSPKPSPAPSMSPTLTPMPTGEPTVEPSMLPSKVPSIEPSALPTYSAIFEEEVTIDQNFEMNFTDGWSGWNVSEVKMFESVMAGYTVNISDSADTSRIKYNCTLLDQQPGKVPPNKVLNQVKYVLYWTSVYVNISGYAEDYPEFINLHKEEVGNDLQAAGLGVIRAEDAISAILTDVPTKSPTISGTPSAIPSFLPTENPSVDPSVSPSNVPSLSPSKIHTGSPSVTSESPSLRPSLPPGAPTSNNGGATTAIVAVIVTLGALILVGLFFFYRRRRRRKEMDFQEAAAGSNALAASGDDQNTQLSSLKVLTDPISSKNWNNTTPRSDDNAVVGMISPSDSLLSNQSLISPGDSMGGYSVEEADGTHHLADEFDQYKDQNLEKMRADVEETLTGSDGMMSQAMTKALMADEDPVADQSDLFWGGSGDPAEIEASALCEVNDWLKRKEGANLEERRGFMQDTMNKMVASVRHGVMKPDGAARTIHECAALLGLELASDIAEDTVIVTGLRKNVTKSDLELTFREFGEIDEAAVASNSRGFGIVRFVSRTSAQETMNKFRLGEIVVQDVAVTVKVLKSQGTSFGTAPPES